MNLNELELDKKTLDYLYDEVTKLLVKNWESQNIENQTLSSYGRAKDLAYKDVMGVITRILNK